MLKTIATAAALAFAAAGAHAAEAMDCCKDGKCCCCAEKKEGETPKKDEPHKH